MSEFTVRGARPEDSDGIAHVQGTSWEESYRGLLPDAAIDAFTAPGVLEKRWGERLHSTDPNPYHTLVAVEPSAAGGETVVGFIGGGPSRDPDLGCPGEVVALYLLASHHGRGIGRALWEAAVADLEARELTPGHVWVLAGNPTIEFYRHVGATEFARRPCRVNGAGHLEEVTLRF